MKGITLVIAMTFLSLSMFGQKADSTFLKAWSAKHNHSNQYKKITLDFTDSNLVNQWKQNQLFYIGSPQQSKYTVDYSTTEKALHIHYEYIGYGTNDNYSDAVMFEYGFSQVNNTTDNNTELFNPFTENDSIIGNYIDMSDSVNSRKVRFTMKVANLTPTDSATVQCGIFDVNSRETNNSIVATGIKPADGYQSIDFRWSYDSRDLPNYIESWNESGLTFADGYTGSWWGIENGHYNYIGNESNGILNNGLPAVPFNTSAYYVPLESAYILPKFMFQINAGSHYNPWIQGMGNGSLDGDMDFYIRKVEFGDISQDGTVNEYVVGGANQGIQGNNSGLPNVILSMGKLKQSINKIDSLYEISLPAKTTIVPTITASTTQTGATIQYLIATSLLDTTRIIVTSPDSTTKKTYYFTYHLLSNDASLHSLTVNNGTMSPVFNSSTFTYNVNVPVGTITVPTVSALINNLYAKTSISIASKIPGKTTVTVTAEDSTKQVYTLNFYSDSLKDISFILPQFVLFENQDINIGGCVNVFNNVSIDFKSADTSIAKIDDQGLLEGVKYGTTKIFAINTNDSTQKDSATILVLPNIIIVGVTVSESGTELQVYVKNGCELYNGIENDFTIVPQSALKAETTIKVTQVLKSSNNPNELLLFLASPVSAGQTVTVSYAPVSIQSDTTSVRTSYTTVLATSSKVIQSNQVKIKLYPNPTQTAITIEADKLQAVKIYNLQGEVVATATANGNRVNLSVEALPSGIYIAELITSSQNVKKTFIKR